MPPKVLVICKRFLQVNFNNFTHFKSDKPILEFVYTDKDTLEIETENLKNITSVFHN